MIIIEWINLIKYQMLAKNSDIIATLRWVRLVHGTKCQIVKYSSNKQKTDIATLSPTCTSVLVTEHKLRVYVLLWESAREGTRPQV